MRAPAEAAGAPRRHMPCPTPLLRRLLPLCVAVLVCAAAVAQPVEVRLPTSNRALFSGEGGSFYMFTDRNFEGEASSPWEGGKYGFVRNLVRTDAGVVGTRLHEGIDIRPVVRDDDGEPLDTVLAISDGRVVYTTQRSRDSNYGLYVVVEHEWQGSPYYSLYAHLNTLDVYAGQPVRMGQPLGRLGYTGAGIDQRRAHVHLEINLLLSDRFDAWFRRYSPRSANLHGTWNGINLAGFDVAGFYHAHHRDPALWLPGWLRRQPWAFVLEVPGGRMLELAQRYPWLLESDADGRVPSGWAITFTETGLPIKVAPMGQPVVAPRLREVAARVRSRRIATNGYLTRSGETYRLSERGRRYAELVATPGLAVSAPAFVPWR